MTDKLNRLTTDWDALFESDEKMDQNGDTFVRLRGLQRLARQAGLTKSWPIHSYVESANLGFIFQCVYWVEFDDGTAWAGSADFNRGNMGRAPFNSYPTAVAESRAEARALRKALGIKSLSVEEIGTLDNTGMPNPAGSIDAQQIASIDRLVSELTLDKLELAKAVFEKEVADSISSWEDLTSAQGMELLRHLNKAKAAAVKGERKGTKGKSRTARKAELEKDIAAKESK